MNRTSKESRKNEVVLKVVKEAYATVVVGAAAAGISAAASATGAAVVSAAVQSLLMWPGCPHL